MSLGVGDEGEERQVPCRLPPDEIDGVVSDFAIDGQALGTVIDLDLSGSLISFGLHDVLVLGQWMHPRTKEVVVRPVTLI
jgi:hypothetical protein